MGIKKATTQTTDSSNYLDTDVVQFFSLVVTTPLSFNVSIKSCLVTPSS